MGKRVLIIIGYLLVSLSTSCVVTDLNEPADSIIDGVEVNLFSSNSVIQQSAASYRNYCIMITDNRASMYLYNLETKEMLCRVALKPGEGKDFMGYVLYHCNQATFGSDFYDESDPFPLLYISQRAGEDKRCFVEVYRIILAREDAEEDYSSMSANLVQTIYFPKMDRENSLGNVNCVIDPDSHQIYTYSRNNDTHDTNYGICKISRFAIPDVYNETVELTDSHIKSSFMLNCSAVNMQGGCICNGILFVGQGSKSAGHIYLNVINLQKQKLEARIDLLRRRFTWEPEGCFSFGERIMITAGNSIWEVNFRRKD